ncbi:MarR family transcriptional regulator [Lactobacillus sp. ESL0679]|uniref:MarR family winged helix-turn-helix transcriptional regulator n=1 Tax=unclassified Lactobacillus TaxID=2620435 RepID=UPI0023F90653|nr:MULTISPECIES: MarR family transcriptional regulator [unclassified Lactobacillus]MDF7682832.1 MarR family transcriptional regulator [Lactobacillus sp. ESL0679]WEV37085.1 MarR family transcriptional regulator [Lactobacillus sp. ESL0677]
MTKYQQILAKYYHLLALDNNEDQEKKWLVAQDYLAQNLSTVHFHILSYLLATPHATATEIRAHLGVLRGTLSKRLTTLIKKGLVVANQDQADARSKHYTLTPAGIQLAQLHNQLLQKKDQQLGHVLDRFTNEELSTIDHFLSDLVTAEENINYH